MKKFIVLTIAMISLFIYSEQNRAGTILEPYAGILLNSKADLENVDEDATLSGTVVGGRIGFQQMAFMAGFNGTRTSIKLDHDVASLDGDQYTAMHYGIFVGYDFPVMVRAWAEYILGGSAENEDDKIKYGKVTGTNFGIGYKVLPFVSVNLEIGNTKWSDGKNDGTEFDTTESVSTYTLGVSIPLSL